MNRMNLGLWLGPACGLGLLAGCGSAQTLLPAEICPSEQVATLSRADVGPQGFSADTLLAEAEQRFGAFDVAWDGTPGVSPSADTFTLTFVGEPTVEHRRAWSASCVGDELGEGPDYLQVTVQADLQNQSGDLLAEGIELRILTPDLATHGPYLLGGGPVEAFGDYLQHLSEENPAGEMRVGFTSEAAHNFLHAHVGGGSAEPTPQDITLERWFETEEAGGASVTYGCAAGVPCMVPAAE